MSVKDAVEVGHSPARLSGALAVVSALIAVLASGFASVLALLFGVLGLVALATGVFALHSQRAVGVGTAVIFLGVLVSGLMGNTTPMLLAATIGSILALDLGQNAISIGRQLSDDAYTRRGETVHAMASVAVGVLVAGLGYGMFLASSGGQPVGAVVLLLLAAVFLIWSFRT